MLVPLCIRRLRVERTMLQATMIIHNVKIRKILPIIMRTIIRKRNATGSISNIVLSETQDFKDWHPVFLMC